MDDAFKDFLSYKMPRSHKVSLGIWHVKRMSKRENEIKLCLKTIKNIQEWKYGAHYELWAVCATAQWWAKNGLWFAWFCRAPKSVTSSCERPVSPSVPCCFLGVPWCAKGEGSTALKITLPHRAIPRQPTLAKYRYLCFEHTNKSTPRKSYSNADSYSTKKKLQSKGCRKSTILLSTRFSVIMEES